MFHNARQIPLLQSTVFSVFYQPLQTKKQRPALGGIWLKARPVCGNQTTTDTGSLTAATATFFWRQSEGKAQITADRGGQAAD